MLRQFVRKHARHHMDLMLVPFLCIPLSSLRSSSVNVKIVSSSVPASFNVPASIPSGRSVVSRKTMTGLPSEGASSWIPPESVKNNMRACGKVMEIDNFKRFNQMNPVVAAEKFIRHFTDCWIHMDRIDDLNIIMLCK